MKLFVGIDVSSEKLDVCFLTDDNQLSILSEISVANDIEGASFIRETILEFNNSYHFDQIVIGMESTSRMCKVRNGLRHVECTAIRSTHL
ncbi:hypothetical protein EfmJHP38_13440 [Enterococcus faecium]|nr:hypothetical protein EfmJHP38_13440 [Enterococcus faecium]